MEASKILKIPLLVTEQYPKGLGKTIPELSIDHACHVFEKTKFSMVTTDSLPAINKLCDGKLQSVVLFGIEASFNYLLLIFLMIFRANVNKLCSIILHCS